VPAMLDVAAKQEHRRIIECTASRSLDTKTSVRQRFPGWQADKPLIALHQAEVSDPFARPVAAPTGCSIAAPPPLAIPAPQPVRQQLTGPILSNGFYPLAAAYIDPSRTPRASNRTGVCP
jgi:hypothetical protein